MIKKNSEKEDQKQSPAKFSEPLTRERIENIRQLIRSLVGAVIGLAITALFSLVVIASVALAFFGDRTQALQILHTALTLAGSALGAVLGYYLGRGAQAKKR